MIYGRIKKYLLKFLKLETMKANHKIWSIVDLLYGT